MSYSLSTLVPITAFTTQTGLPYGDLLVIKSSDLVRLRLILRGIVVLLQDRSKR